MNKLKFNIPYLKKWAKTIINKSETYSEYDNKMPIDWNINDFSNWFIDHAVNHGTTANSFTEKVFGIPSGTKLIDFFETKENAGSGLNGDRYWNKYGSIKSALYDVWEFLKPKLTGNKNESTKPIKKTHAVALIESIVRKQIMSESINATAIEYINEAFNHLYEGLNKVEIALSVLKRSKDNSYNDVLTCYREIDKSIDKLSKLADKLEGQ